MPAMIAIITIVFGLDMTALLIRIALRTGCVTIKEKNASSAATIVVTARKKHHIAVRAQVSARNAGLPRIANGGRNVKTIFALRDRVMKNVLKVTSNMDIDVEMESGCEWNVVGQKIVWGMNLVLMDYA